MRTQPCPICGVEFTAPDKRKTCSIPCKSAMRRRNDPFLDRFWSRVTVAGPDDCWLWTGLLNNQGYGRFTLDYGPGSKSTRVLAHRFAYEITTAQDARGWVVLHSCDTPRCVNPAHLSLGTQSDNMRDARDKGRLDLSGLALGLPYRYARRAS